MNSNLRETIIWVTVKFGLLIVLFTEILSIFSSLNSHSIKYLWIFTFLILVTLNFFLKKKKNLNTDNFSLPFFFNYEFYWILLIFFITLIISLLYPPNSLDSLSYHLPRILSWSQQESVNFYPTNDLRELIMGPFSQYVILHLYLLSGGDFLFNIVQWTAMFVSCITISLISKEFGCNIKYQIFTVLFCATIPIGILQSTSTQTDYVATMWLTIIAYSIIKFISTQSLKNIFLFSSSLGLGLLTKGTVYIFGFSFCIWIAIYLISKRKNFRYLFLIPLIVITINLGHFIKNQDLTSNPIGLVNENNIYTNKIINLSSFSSNLIRNTGLNLAVPSQNINLNFTKKFIDKLHDYIGLSSRDTRTTKGGGYYIPFSFYESTAPNTFHFLIIMVSLILLATQNKSRVQKHYSLSVLFGYLFFSLIMVWAIQNNRHLLSFFVLSSPIVAFSLMSLKINKFKNVISILLILYSIPYLLFNKSRPLLGELKVIDKKIELNKPYFKKFKNKNEMYYIADNIFRQNNLHNEHANITKIITKSDCKIIVFDMPGYNDLIYPLMKLIKEESKNEIKFKRVNVNNISKKYYNTFDIKKSCIINLDQKYISMNNEKRIF